MTFSQFIGSGSTGVIGVINTVIIPFIFALAFAFFLWGVFKHFFIHGTDDKEREKGRQFILWGVLGIVVLLSVWGLVRMLLSTLGIAPS